MILDAIRVIAMLTPLARGAVTHPREKIPPATALLHAYHASAAATEAAPSGVLFYLGYREARFTRQYHPGRGQCGVTQIETYDDVEWCRELADDPVEAYRAAAEHLGEWVLFCQRDREKPAGVGRTGRALYSIDRIDNSKGYEPGNCKWSTATEQNRNRRPQGTGARRRLQRSA